MGKMKVCIDAGHYGKYNRSPVVPEYYESDMTWKLHLMFKEILEGYGFEVSLTRDNQAADKAVYDRGYAAKGCVLFLSVHSNACSSESVDYPVVYRGYDNIGGCDVLASKLAQAIASTMGTAQAGRTATRKGSSGGEYYGVLRGARAAGLSDYYILEHSFHTNTKSTRWLLEDGNLRKLAAAECRAIAEHYGMAGGPGQEDGSSKADASDQVQASGQEQGNGDNGTAFSPYMVSTTCDVLNIRSGPGTLYPIVGTISEREGKKKKYTIVEEEDGWGKLKSGAGYISLSYTRKVSDAPSGTFSPYLITTTCDMLNIRSGPGTQYPVVGTISEKVGEKKKYTIVEEEDGWGRLKSGAGYISLFFTRMTS